MKAKIEKWYKQGLWTLKMVKSAVMKGVITAEEYQEITGNMYEKGGE